MKCTEYIIINAKSGVLVRGIILYKMNFNSCDEVYIIYNIRKGCSPIKRPQIKNILPKFLKGTLLPYCANYLSRRVSLDKVWTLRKDIQVLELQLQELNKRLKKNLDIIQFETFNKFCYEV